MALTLIAFLVLVSSALGASAGDEYLPKVPSLAGSSSGAASSGATTSGSSHSSASTGTVSPQSDGSAQQAREAHKPAKKGDKSNRHQQAVTLASGSGGGGGDGSGSILLSPLVIAMIAAVVAAAVGMTLSRRAGDDAETESEGPPRGRTETDGPRTPDGEIIAGPDQAT